MDETKHSDYALGFGYCPRAPYATHPSQTRGRLFPEQESYMRSPFQRDRDRIIHSTAFRRLKHKTQVFVAPEGDHYRTRLTHSLEVSQIARALARAFRLDEELAEAIALAHDLGHTPFGHVGEEALNEMMQPYGGFDHNSQTLRIVTALENHYIDFDGLNLSWETLEGIVKHNGPLLHKGQDISSLPEVVRNFNKQMDLDLDLFSGAEAQCAAIADDIAYNAHDIDDGLRSGFIKLNDLEQVSITRDLIETIKKRYKNSNIDEDKYGYELARRQIRRMVEDVIQHSQKCLEALAPKSVQDIYNTSSNVITFSPKLEKENKELKTFLYKNFYHHPKILEERNRATQTIKTLFSIYMQNKKKLPEEWQKRAQELNDHDYARLIADFISGMTDIYAFEEKRRLTA